MNIIDHVILKRYEVVGAIIPFFSKSSKFWHFLYILTRGNFSNESLEIWVLVSNFFIPHLLYSHYAKGGSFLSATAFYS